MLDGNALPNENDAADFGILERGCSMDGNCQQQKTTNQDTVEISCGTSSFTPTASGAFTQDEFPVAFADGKSTPDGMMNGKRTDCFLFTLET